MHRLLLEELLIYDSTLGLRVTQYLQAVSKQPFFEVLIVLVGDIEDACQTLFLDVDQHAEEDANLREVEYEDAAEVVLAV